MMKLLLLLCWLGAVSSLHSDTRHIHLRHFKIHTRESPQWHQQEKHLEYLSKFHPETHFEWIVHIVHPVTKEKREAIEKFVNTKLGRYLPHNSFFITGPRSLAEKLGHAPHVLWVGAYKPKHKIPRDLWSEAKHDHYRFNILTHQNSNVHELASRWEKLYETETGRKASFHAHDTHHIIAQIPDPSHTPRFARWVARQSETHWIEKRPTYTFQNKWGVPVTQGGTCEALGATPGATQLNNIRTRALTGKDVTVEINDQGAREATCYLPNGGGTQTGSDNTDGPSGHGTAIAAVVGGQASSTPASEYNGVAPNAKLVNNRIRNDDGAFELPRPVGKTFSDWLAKNQNINVMVQAFASSTSAEYNADTLALDDWCVGNSNTLLIFPSGNNGNRGTKSVSSPSTAKNVLTVGGSLNCRWELSRGKDAATANLINSKPEYYNENVVYTYSGRGPTSDGRIKPDVIAPAHVFSADASQACATKEFNGTSFSAAFAGGAAALALEYLNDPTMYNRLYNVTGGVQQVSSAQVKAILINSGVAASGIDVGQKGQIKWGTPTHFNTFTQAQLPNEYQGFGRISLDNTLWFGNEPLSQRMLFERNFDAAVKVGETTRYCFTCKRTTCTIKATLVWTDPPSDVSSGINLVSDLDLVMTDRATGLTWKGNQQLTKGSNFDSLNNVEQIWATVPGSTNGRVYNILVYGATLPLGEPQKYALVASGELEFFSQNTGPKTCPDSTTALPLFAPNNCSGNGNPLSTGVCQCNAGFFGVDCSSSRCPNNCKADNEQRGVCDFDTSTCVCLIDFTGADCATRLAPREAIPKCATDSGHSTGVLIGVAVGCLILGLLFGLILGWFIAVKYLEDKRKKRRQQLISGGQQS